MPSAEARAVFDQARQSEKIDGKRAIALYQKAVKMENGFAAKRLAEIYEKGELGMHRDFQAVLEWWDVAHRLGVNVPRGCGVGR